MAATIVAQRIVDGIEQVGAHHADFVYYEQINRPQHVNLVLTHTVALFRHLVFRHEFLYVGQIGAKRQLKLRMDSNAASIDSRHAGRSNNHMTLVYRLYNMTQKGGFSSASLTRQEDRDIGVAKILLGKFKLRIREHGACRRKVFNGSKSRKYLPIIKR